MPKIPGVRLDPLPAFKFYVTLVDRSGAMGAINSSLMAVANYAVAGFSECSGLETTMEPYTYRQGGENDRVRKFEGHVDYSNLTLKRGMSLSDDLWLWHQSYLKGKGKRRDGIVAVMNDLGIPIKVWYFRRGLPVRWLGPAFDAKTSAVAIEAIEIAHEGFLQYSAGVGLSAGLDRLI